MENITVHEIYKTLEELKEEIKSISKKDIYSDISKIKFEIVSVNGICDSLSLNLERVENKINKLLLGEEKFSNEEKIEEEYPEETFSSKIVLDRELRRKYELLEKRICDLEKIVYAREYTLLNKSIR